MCCWIGAARGAKKHPVSEAVLRFATEKKGAKAGPFVNKIFEMAVEGAEQKVQQLEEADAASADGAQPLALIAINSFRSISKYGEKNS